MEFSTINWLAILVTSLVGFVIGPLWYGPLFGKKWMQSIDKTKEEFSDGDMMVFVWAFVFQFIMAACLYMFFYGGPATTEAIGAEAGTFYGFLTGIGWIAPAIAVTALFEMRSWKYIAINGCYWILVFTLMGLILGLWR